MTDTEMQIAQAYMIGLLDGAEAALRANRAPLAAPLDWYKELPAEQREAVQTTTYNAALAFAMEKLR